MNPWTSIRISKWRYYLILGARRNDLCWDRGLAASSESFFVFVLEEQRAAMEKQSRWSEQRVEQRVEQREQRTQQRTEQHFTRQLVTQQRGEYSERAANAYRARAARLGARRRPRLSLVSSCVTLFVHSVPSRAAQWGYSERCVGARRRRRPRPQECSSDIFISHLFSTFILKNNTSLSRSWIFILLFHFI